MKHSSKRSHRPAGTSNRNGGSKGKRPGQRRPTFKGARLEEKKDDESSAEDAADPGVSSESDSIPDIISDGDSTSGDDNREANSYGSLLQSLSAKQPANSHQAKKRKLSNGTSKTTAESAELSSQQDISKPDNSNGHAHAQGDSDLSESGEEDVDDDLEAASDVDQQDLVDDDTKDPFEAHFGGPDTKVWSEHLKKFDPQKRAHVSSNNTGLSQRTTFQDWDESLSKFLPRARRFEEFCLKRRLLANGQAVLRSTGQDYEDIASALFSYRDVLVALRTVDNANLLRRLAMLHALNHVFKTRDRILKNNSKLAQADTDENSEFRDQGFTRPKILILIPTRQACVRFIDSLVELCEPEQQENKVRFLDSFKQDDDEAWDDKPHDFKDLFGGNDDDMFRIGLKFTRKTIKLFSAFYSSDIILASPLGLRSAMETGGSKSGKKMPDFDFLSSIEMVIVDHATALFMQNWQHVEYVFSRLNLIPKESHGCDFSRVRHWYLDGNARHFRQTVILTDFMTPEINGLCNKYMLNLAGKTQYSRTNQKAALDSSMSALVHPVTKTFYRFNVASSNLDSDLRFSFFTSTILPSLLPSLPVSKSRPKDKGKGTLIFTSTYADFLRVRNHLSTSATTTSLSFGAISEYSSVRDVARARSHFLTGRHSVLLYSERAHHFRRYVLRGVRSVVFYSLPNNPVFWTEVVSMLEDQKGGQGRADDMHRRGGVRVLFSKFDRIKLGRIVGSQREVKMVNQNIGDVFEFT